MKKNVGQIDRIIRIIVGTIILVLGLVFKSWWGLIGVIPIVTAAISYCPLYLPFGFSTCKLEGKEGKSE